MFRVRFPIKESVIRQIMLQRCSKEVCAQ